MMTKLRSTKNVLFVWSRRKQHPVPMRTATSFPGSLILPPRERAPSAPGAGNMRDPGNEVVRTVVNGRKFTTSIDVTWPAPILTNQGQLCTQVLDVHFPHIVLRQSMYVKPPILHFTVTKRVNLSLETSAPKLAPAVNLLYWTLSW